MCELCYDGWTDQDAICGADSCGSREQYIQIQIPHRKGYFWGGTCQHIVTYLRGLMCLPSTRGGQMHKPAWGVTNRDAASCQRLYDSCIESFLGNWTVKELWKSVYIGRSYDQKSSASLFLRHGVGCCVDSWCGRWWSRVTSTCLSLSHASSVCVTIVGTRCAPSWPTVASHCTSTPPRTPPSSLHRRSTYVRSSSSADLDTPVRTTFWRFCSWKRGSLVSIIIRPNLCRFNQIAQLCLGRNSYVENFFSSWLNQREGSLLSVVCCEMNLQRGGYFCAVVIHQ